MPPVRTIISILAVATMLGACLGTGPEVPIRCVAPLASPECEHVIRVVLDEATWDQAALGTLTLAEAQGIPDCARAARSSFVPELADPAIDRCWVVRLEWQRGERAWHVARYQPSGEVRLVD